MNSDHLPDEFLVEYGPILHPHEGFSIKLNKKGLIYRPIMHSLHEEQIIPTESQWRKFWREIDELGLWEWELEYQLCCLDGTAWKVKIGYKDQEMESMGQNHFPDTFLDFLDAVEDLISREIEIGF